MTKFLPIERNMFHKSQFVMKSQWRPGYEYQLHEAKCSFNVVIVFHCVISLAVFYLLFEILFSYDMFTLVNQKNGPLFWMKHEKCVEDFLFEISTTYDQINPPSASYLGAHLKDISAS